MGLFRLTAPSKRFKSDPVIKSITIFESHAKLDKIALSVSCDRQITNPWLGIVGRALRAFKELRVVLAAAPNECARRLAL